MILDERTKEELKAGKSLFSAVEQGFKRAFSSIFDSNVTTLISCSVLYNFGTGLIRGFALTLAIGVLVSMFTAINVTRTLLRIILEIKPLKRLEYYGLPSAAVAARTVTSRRHGRSLTSRVSSIRP